MLRKYSHERSLRDNINLGVITGFAAGMVNVAAFILFFSFTSNITGYYAILANEIAERKVSQTIIVLSWIALFFLGSFVSNFIILSGKRRDPVLFHAIPLVLEMCLLLFVWYYGDYHYQESLAETELLIAILLFTMGIQNGLTATISNFQVRTTHLTGQTTDLAIHTAMLTDPEYRKNPEVWNKIKLFSCIITSYVLGGIVSGVITHWIEFKVFLVITLAIGFIITYDYFYLLGLKGKGKETREGNVH